MTNMQLLHEGLTLMWVGVGFVMLFLFILVFAIRLMSYCVNRFFPEPVVEQNGLSQSMSDSDSQSDLTRLRPVIVAAIAHHRRQQITK